MARSKTSLPTLPAAVCDLATEAEATLMSAQATLIEARRGMVQELPLLVAWPSVHTHGILLQDDPGLQEACEHSKAVRTAYHVALEDVRTATAALALARRQDAASQAATTQAEREERLRASDEEYQAILEDVERYTRLCRENDGNPELSNAWRRSKFQLAQALQRKAAKIAASPAA